VFKEHPQLNKNNANKSHREAPGERSIFSINRVNENQQVVLMRINKPILLRNENGYRFHSHHSKANLKSRTQSTTIARSLVSLVLYIYKKWNCVESLTFTRWTLTVKKDHAILGTSTTQQAYWTLHKSSQPRRRGNLHWYAQRGVTGGLDRPLKAEKDLANQFFYQVYRLPTVHFLQVIKYLYRLFMR